MHPAVSSRVVFVFPLLAVTALFTACPPPPVADERPDAGVERPDAGEPTPNETPPTWAGQTASRRWLREGFGEMRAVQAVDVDGDGSMEVVIGARGVALLDSNSRSGRAPRWSMNWRRDANNVLSGGENDWVEAMALVDVNGDGVADPLFTNSARAAYAVDARTGAELWFRELDAELYTARMALFDGDDDGVRDFFPSGGYSAYSGKTGAPLWSLTLPRPTIFVVSASNFDGKPGGDLLVTTEEDACVGICPPPDPDDPRPANVHAVGSDGTFVFQALVTGNVVAAAAADVDGDGVDEAIVGTTEGAVHALSADGELWSVDLGDGFAARLAAGDVDGDGKAEVFAGHHDLARTFPGEVVGLSSAGAVQWRHLAGGQSFSMELAQLDGDDALELLVGAGDGDSTSGGALALKTAAQVPARELWRVDVGMPVDSFSLATIDGDEVVLIGGRDSQVRAVHPESGEAKWTWAGGGYVFAVGAGDLDGDGTDEVVSGDDRALLIASNGHDGAKRWSRQLDVGNVGLASAVTVADVLPGGGAEVIAGGVRYYQLEPGVLEIYSATGEQRLSLFLEARVWEVTTADLNGDGQLEILTAEQDPAGECAVHAMDAEGTRLWRTPVSSCEQPSIHVGDADGDGAVEIAYGEVTLFSPPQVALLDADGAIRWRHTPTEKGEDGAWVRVVNGGVVYGGFAVDYQGHVTFRAADDGELQWQALFAAQPDPEVPSTPIDAGSWYGALVPDADGDGVGEIAVSTDTCELHVISGADGDVLWTRRLEPMGRAWNQRRIAGPVTWVPETKTVPGWIAVAQSNNRRSHAEAFAFKLDGEALGGFAMEGEAHDIVPARFGDGSVGAAVGAGLGVHALELTAP